MGVSVSFFSYFTPPHPPFHVDELQLAFGCATPYMQKKCAAWLCLIFCVSPPGDVKLFCSFAFVCCVFGFVPTTGLGPRKR